MSKPKRTIYDLSVCLSWAKIHAHYFYERDEAELFVNSVEGQWVIHPGQDPEGRRIFRVANSAGCYVMSFNRLKL